MEVLVNGIIVNQNPNDDNTTVISLSRGLCCVWAPRMMRKEEDILKP